MAVILKANGNLNEPFKGVEERKRSMQEIFKELCLSNYSIAQVALFQGLSILQNPYQRVTI